MSLRHSASALIHHEFLSSKNIDVDEDHQSSHKKYHDVSSLGIIGSVAYHPSEVDAEEFKESIEDFIIHDSGDDIVINNEKNKINEINHNSCSYNNKIEFDYVNMNDMDDNRDSRERDNNNNNNNNSNMNANSNSNINLKNNRMLENNKLSLSRSKIQPILNDQNNTDFQNMINQMNDNEIVFEDDIEKIKQKKNNNNNTNNNNNNNQNKEPKIEIKIEQNMINYHNLSMIVKNNPISTNNSNNSNNYENSTHISTKRSHISSHKNIKSAGSNKSKDTKKNKRNQNIKNINNKVKPILTVNIPESPHSSVKPKPHVQRPTVYTDFPVRPANEGPLELETVQHILATRQQFISNDYILKTQHKQLNLLKYR